MSGSLPIKAPALGDVPELLPTSHILDFHERVGYRLTRQMALPESHLNYSEQDLDAYEGRSEQLRSPVPGRGAAGIPVLRIGLFGGLTMQREDWLVPARLTRGAEAVLAYLALHRRRAHARDELAGTFWRDVPEDRARACLNTVLWRIRRVLEPDGESRGRYIETTPSGDIRFGAAGGYWLDTEVFEETLDALLPVPPEQLGADNVGRLAAAADLYRGDLLAGVFDDWALTERERLRARYVEAQVHLMAAHRACGDLQQSLDCGRRVLVIDPLCEHVHRELMALYRDSGQSAQAVRQYELCRHLLAGQLGVAPDTRTQALRSRLDAGDETRGGVAPSSAKLKSALDLLAQGRAAINEAELRIAEALNAASAAVRSDTHHL
jgi:DNA-binding SARP family transcriptional activator